MSTEFKAVPAQDLTERDRAINRVADAVHRMNEAIQRAVSSGISVELVRVSRYHDGAGSWGSDDPSGARGRRGQGPLTWVPMPPFPPCPSPHRTGRQVPDRPASSRWFSRIRPIITARCSAAMPSA